MDNTGCRTHDPCRVSVATVLSAAIVDEGLREETEHHCAPFHSAHMYWSCSVNGPGVETPISVSRDQKPGVVTRHTVLSYIYTCLYRPTKSWPRLAEVLSDLITGGNGSSVLDETAWKEVPRSEQGLAVLCSDAAPAHDISVDEWLDQAKQYTEKSFVSGELRALHTFACRTWRGRAKERYLGKFNKTLANTVLLIGGTHDPATPLRNARRLAEDMGVSARLIVHHGFGHTSTNHVSACTSQHIQDFFLSDSVPEAMETHCFPTDEIFPGSDSGVKGGISTDQSDLLGAMRSIRL